MKYQKKKTASDYIKDIKDLLDLANQEIKERNQIISSTLQDKAGSKEDL